jgi:hypothetical protein
LKQVKRSKQVKRF